MVSDNQNINININDGSSNIAVDDSNNNMTTTEQAASTEERDLPTMMDPAEYEQATTELLIGTWNI